MISSMDIIIFIIRLVLFYNNNEGFIEEMW